MPNGFRLDASDGRRKNQDSMERAGVPFKVGEARRVAEAFGERIAVDLQFGNQLVLVGSHCCEHRLGEDVRAELLGLEVGERCVVALDAADQVHSRLGSVHRVQHNLQKKTNKQIIITT